MTGPKVRTPSDGGLRKLFRERVGPGQWTSVESGITGGGIPDAYAILAHGHSIWVEFKRAHAWAIKFRPLQIGWHLTHARHGGISFVAVRRVPPASPTTDELWIVRGAAVERLQVSGLRGLEQGDLAGRWEGGPRSWNWRDVGEVLRS